MPASVNEHVFVHKRGRQSPYPESLSAWTMPAYRSPAYAMTLRGSCDRDSGRLQGRARRKAGCGTEIRSADFRPAEKNA